MANPIVVGLLLAAGFGTLYWVSKKTAPKKKRKKKAPKAQPGKVDPGEPTPTTTDWPEEPLMTTLTFQETLGLVPPKVVLRLQDTLRVELPFESELGGSWGHYPPTNERLNVVIEGTAKWYDITAWPNAEPGETFVLIRRLKYEETVLGVQPVIKEEGRVDIEVVPSS